MKLLRKWRAHTDATDSSTSEVHDIVRRVFGGDLVLKEKNIDGPGALRVKYVQHLTKNLHRILGAQQQGNKSKWFRSSRKLTQEPELDEDPLASDMRPGRLGPRIVVFDATAGIGRLVLAGDERVRVEALSNFATARATACVHAGRWMYELHLATGGIMQVGWCTAACEFTTDAGVGDTVRSYSYDGGRVRSWNVATRVYGEPWQAGDVIGCLLDLQQGTVNFYRNGRDLGVAFSKVERAPGVAYFPAVSLAMQECVYANFGHVPFVYPVNGYRPMQSSALRECARAAALLRSAAAIVREMNAPQTNAMNNDTKTGMLNRLRKQANKPEQPAAMSTSPENRQVETPAMSKKAFMSSLARLTFGLLSPMLRSSYIVVAEFLPHIRYLALADYDRHRKDDFVDLYTTFRERPNQELIGFLDLLHSFSDETTVSEAFEHCAVRECLIYDQITQDMTYSAQMKTLYWLCGILQHTSTRQMMLKFVLFGKISFDTFLHLKPPEDEMLARLVRNPWWEKPVPVENETDARVIVTSNIQNDVVPKSDADAEKAYLEDCDKITKLIMPLENLQVEYVKIILENSDGTARIPSTRKIFLGKFRRYIINNCIMDMRLFSVSRPSPPRSLDTFSRLLSASLALWRTESQVSGRGRGASLLSMPTKAFYDGSFDFYNADRLGGVLAFLVRTLRQELVDVLGENHPFLMSFEPRHNRGGGIDIGVSVSEAGGMMSPNLATLPQVISSIARFMQTMGPEIFPDAMTGGTSLSMKDHSSLSGAAGGLESRGSLLRMLDGLLALYHHSAAKQMEELSEARDAQLDMSDCLYDLETRLAAVVQEMESEDKGVRNTIKSDRDDEVTAVGVATNKQVLRSIVAELTRSKATYEEQLRVSSLRGAWTRGAVWTRARQQQVAVALRAALLTIRDAADPPGLTEAVSSKEIFPPKSSLLTYDQEPSYASLDLRYSSSSGQSNEAVEILEPTLEGTEESLTQTRTSPTATSPIPIADPEITSAASMSGSPEAAPPATTASGAPASAELFSFVPHYYVEAALELSNTLRLYMHPTRSCNSLEGWETILADTASLLCSHISDSRIVISSSREAIVQTLASFATHQDTMAAIERVPLPKQMRMIEELVKPYASRTWAQTNWVLVRFWHGSGFGYRHRQWPHLAHKYGDRVPTVTNLGAKVDAGLMSQCFGPCPSLLIQSRISSYFQEHPAATAAFLNSLLTQLNWAFSEFVNMVQELEAASDTVTEARAVKLAATCFDLYHGLARALELALHAAPRALTDQEASDGSAELLLHRTCQTLCGVLSRVCLRSCGSASFVRVTSRALPHAERVHHYPALAPIAGCILEMLKDDMESDRVGKVTTALVSEPLFRLDAIEFMLGRGNDGIFSFHDYPDDVTQSELASLSRASSWLSRAAESRVKSGSSSASGGTGTSASQERLCPICYARPADATFLPCGHHSCRSCIQQHLLNSNQCFFCKAVVEGVRDISTEDVTTPVTKDNK